MPRECCFQGDNLLDHPIPACEQHDELTARPRLGPVNVLHLIGQLSRGGCELQLLGLVRNMPPAEFRHTVGVFWPGGDPEIIEGLRDAGCDVVCLNKKHHIDLGFVRRLKRLLRSHPRDVVHAWLMSAGLWGRLAEMMTGRVPTVVSFRSQEVHRWPGGVRLDRFLARYTDLFICNSSRVQVIWQRRLKSDDARVRVVINGVDCHQFGPGPSADKREELGISPESFVVTQVGTMKPAKNWPMFLAVAAKVIAQHPQAVFLAVGEGPLLEDVRAQAAALDGAGNRIRLLGNRIDVPDILRASNVALSTSDIEGMPNAVLEAMASGLPVVATRVSGSEELVRHEQTGYLVSPGDADQAADHLIGILQGRALAERMGQAARATAQQEYSFEQMAARHGQAYREAIALHRG